MAYGSDQLGKCKNKTHTDRTHNTAYMMVTVEIFIYVMQFHFINKHLPDSFSLAVSAFDICCAPLLLLLLYEFAVRARPISTVTCFKLTHRNVILKNFGV